MFGWHFKQETKFKSLARYGWGLEGGVLEEHLQWSIRFTFLCHWVESFPCWRSIHKLHKIQFRYRFYSHFSEDETLDALINVSSSAFGRHEKTHSREGVCDKTNRMETRFGGSKGPWKLFIDTRQSRRKHFFWHWKSSPFRNFGGAERTRVNPNRLIYFTSRISGRITPEWKNNLAFIPSSKVNAISKKRI